VPILTAPANTGPMPGPVDVATLKTTITGLTPGESYQLYGFFFGRDGSDEWDIQFGTTETELAVFADLDSPFADTLTFVTNPSFVDAGVILLQYGDLGVHVASAAGTLDVFVDDGPSNDRTWYEGVGYELSASNPVLLGDVDLNGAVNFADIPAFIALLQSGGFQAEADVNEDGAVNFSDIGPFIDVLTNQ